MPARHRIVDTHANRRLLIGVSLARPPWARRVAQANGHVGAARSVGLTVAPLLGGALAGAEVVHLGLLLDAASFVAVADRAFASSNAARNGAELAALGAGGVLVDLAGSQLALAVSGAVPLAIGAVTLLVIIAPARRRRTVYA